MTAPLTGQKSDAPDRMTRTPQLSRVRQLAVIGALAKALTRGTAIRNGFGRNERADRGTRDATVEITDS